MTYQVRFTREARADLKRLLGSLAMVDPALARKAQRKIDKSVSVLQDFPFTCRKALPENSFLRELVIRFGTSGYVALFEIEDDQFITVLAVRHQREDDYL